jgi:hypothetical protein
MFSAEFHIWHKACIAVLSIHQRITKPFRGAVAPTILGSLNSIANQPTSAGHAKTQASVNG